MKKFDYSKVYPGLRIIEKKMVVTLATCLCLLVGFNTHASGPFSDVQEPLEFIFQPSSAVYNSGQAIEFKLWANQPVYLYLYSLTADNRLALVLPNALQENNKYPMQQVTIVPQAGVEFIADGMQDSEVFYAVATTTPGSMNPVAVAKLLEVFKDNKLASKEGALYLRHDASAAQYAIQRLELSVLKKQQLFADSVITIGEMVQINSYPCRVNAIDCIERSL